MRWSFGAPCITFLLVGMLLGEGAGHAFFVLVMVWCGPAYNLFLGAPSECVPRCRYTPLPATTS